jgi:hypothetical protein
MPYSLLEKQTLQLVSTEKHRAPPPSLLRPAAPAEQIWVRAGQEFFSPTTLNAGQSQRLLTCATVVNIIWIHLQSTFGFSVKLLGEARLRFLEDPSSS